MSNQFRRSAALAAFVCSAGAAHAADLYTGRQRPLIEPRPLERSYRYPGQPGIWQGLNVGLDAGYNWSRALEIGGSDTVDLGGALVGGHLGYNWQRGMAVLGVETDLAWSNADGSRSYGALDGIGFRNHWLSSFRLKGGIAIDNVLVYATGGIALGGFDADLTTPGGVWWGRDTLIGWVAGGGIETKITSSLSARVEALYHGFDDAKFPMAGGDVRADLSSTTVQAGLTYHFGN